jgi:hypothetical protein
MCVGFWGAAVGHYDTCANTGREARQDLTYKSTWNF